MPTTVENELKQVETELLLLIDKLFDIRSSILNTTERSPMAFLYIPNRSTGNLPEVTLEIILNNCKQLHFLSRKMVKLIHSVGFEKFMVRLLAQAYAPTSEAEMSCSEMDNYYARTESYVDVDANLSLIGNDKVDRLTLPSNFNLKNDLNVFNCDQIIAQYASFISEDYGKERGSVQNGKMTPHFRLQEMSQQSAIETVSHLSPTNNVHYCITLINDWGDFIHKELLRSMRTIPTEFCKP